MRARKSVISVLVAVIVVIGALLSAQGTVPDAAAQADLVIWTEESTIEPLEYSIQEFEQETGIGVTVEDVGQSQIRDWLVETDDPSAGPDIFFLSDDFIWALEHVLAPVDLGDGSFEFAPYAVQASTHNGQLVMLPFVLRTLVLYRNTDLVSDAPQTWDDLIAEVAAVSESGAATYGFVVWNDGGFHFAHMLTAFGGYVFAPRDDGTFDTGDIGLNNEGSHAFFTTLQALAQQQNLDSDMNWETAHQAFESGDAAMIISGPWVIGRFEGAGVPFAVSPIPAGTQPARPYVHVSGFGINADSDNQDAAQLFLTDYVATENSIAMLADYIGGVPAHLTALEKLEDPTQLAFAQAMRDGQLYPGRVPEMEAVWWPLEKAINAILYEGANVQETLDIAVEEIAGELN